MAVPARPPRPLTLSRLLCLLLVAIFATGAARDDPEHGPVQNGAARTAPRLVVLLSLTSRQADATWSIVAVDPTTREVGAAAATCTVGVEVIYGGVPGSGVIVAQAATNLSARRKGVEMIASGSGPREVISRIASEEFNPGGLWRASWQEQQYGVAVLGAAPPAGHFTGDETVPWSGGIADGTVSVQGNMLYGREVVDAALLFLTLCHLA